MTEVKDTHSTPEPNPPLWPPSVKVFHPSDDFNEIMNFINKTEDPRKTYEFDGTSTRSTRTSEKHFSLKRWALLFAPGIYRNLRFEVGYYVQVAGLGAAADDVKFIGDRSGPFIPALNKDLPVTEGGTIAYAGSGLSLDTFWRSAENFYTNTSDGMMWAVSQAAPLRRVHVDTSLSLTDGGAYASGGVLANSVVSGTTNFGSQQQWISRNVEFQNDVLGGAWSLVFVGCTGMVPKPGIVGNCAYTVESNPGIRVEKPFVALDGDRFKLRVPPTSRVKLAGPELDGSHDDVRDFDRVKVGIPNPEKEDDQYNTLGEADDKLTDDLQTALDEGKDLLLAPGIFFLTRSLVLNTPNQVVLGLGLATLVAPQDGSPCIKVAPKTSGIRIAGIMLEASVQKSNQTSVPTMTKASGGVDSVASLLEWGEPGVNDPGNDQSPGVLTDVFARVGGSNLSRNVSTDVMVRIHSGNIVGDNLWLWRADHVKLRPGEEANDQNFPYYHQTEEGECTVKTALEVYGDNVTIFGLFCEHAVEHQMVWSGNHGKVSFYQSELPYDVSHDTFGKKGYVGYKVNETVYKHDAIAVGVYSNFKKEVVNVSTAITTNSENDKVVVTNPFTVFLSNYGHIHSVINHEGEPAVRFEGPSRV